MFPKRYLVTSPKWFNYCKDNYNNKVIEYSIYCPSDEIYYLDKNNVFKQINMEDKSIWTALIDNNGWPTGLKKRIR